MATISITPGLCEFVCALIGDGNLWTKGYSYRVELTGHPRLDLEYYDYLGKIFYDSFGKHP